MPMNPSIAERRVFGRPISEIDDDVVVDHTAQHPTIALVGRFLLAALFLMSGISKLTDTAGTAAHMTAAGIPYAEALAMVGAVSLVIGLLTRIGSVGLILFMIPTTVIFHGFWNYEGAERVPQMINFMKNLAIIGGLAIAVAFGAGRFSLDHVLHRSHDR